MSKGQLLTSRVGILREQSLRALVVHPMKLNPGDQNSLTPPSRRSEDRASLQNYSLTTSRG